MSGLPHIAAAVALLVAPIFGVVAAPAVRWKCSCKDGHRPTMPPVEMPIVLQHNNTDAANARRRHNALVGRRQAFKLLLVCLLVMAGGATGHHALSHCDIVMDFGLDGREGHFCLASVPPSFLNGGRCRVAET